MRRAGERHTNPFRLSETHVDLKVQTWIPAAKATELDAALTLREDMPETDPSVPGRLWRRYFGACMSIKDELRRVYYCVFERTYFIRTSFELPHLAGFHSGTATAFVLLRLLLPG